jgi:hypothetical protein
LDFQRRARPATRLRRLQIGIQVGGNMAITVSISHVKDHLKCPRMAFYRHRLHRGLPPHSAALSFGTQFHKMMEYKMSGQTVPWDELRTDCHPLAWRDWDNMREVMEDWLPPPEWKILAIELPLTDPTRRLQGRLDAIVEMNDMIWSVQYKTVSANRQVADLIEEVRIGWHECNYEALLRDVYKPAKPIGGTIGCFYRKLPTHRRVNGKLVEVPLEDRKRASWAIYPLPRERDILERRIDDTNVLITAMDNQERVIMNTDACFGVYGNSKCEYYDVCHNKMDIYSPPYIQLESRY